MRKSQLVELLELAKLQGNAEMVAKLEQLLGSETLSWERAEKLARENRLTVKRGCYTQAAQFLVDFTPEDKREQVLQILSAKITGKDE